MDLCFSKALNERGKANSGCCVLQALHKRWMYDKKDKEHRVCDTFDLAFCFVQASRHALTTTIEFICLQTTKKQLAESGDNSSMFAILILIFASNIIDPRSSSSSLC